jgi:hypothetical protein
MLSDRSRVSSESPARLEVRPVQSKHRTAAVWRHHSAAAVPGASRWVEDLRTAPLGVQPALQRRRGGPTQKAAARLPLPLPDIGEFVQIDNDRAVD